jgi:hypothetical protein
MQTRGKKKGWFKVCPEKWIHGSTREEMTSAERGVWIDFLALAFMNDPPGQIDFFTYKRLANQLHITVKLLKSTINKALFYKKIELKEKKSNPTSDQLKTKSDTLETNLLKIGLPLRTIIILNWNEYQSEYLRQKPYRQRKSEEEEVVEEGDEQYKKLQDSDSKSVTQVTDRGEEKRKEEIRKKEIRGDKKREEETIIDSNSKELESPVPSNSKSFNKGKNNLLQEYLSRLRDCTGYPFEEYKDTSLFHHINGDYPRIDILKELDKKIAWWKKHPDALKPSASPRQKLAEWFENEHEFQNRRDT